MKTNPYAIVRGLEIAVADYAGAPYGVAVESCTSALLLACAYCRVEEVVLPRYTYVGVAMSVLHAGGRIRFEDMDWEGAYPLKPYPIVDSARRFRRNMYQRGMLWCVSFHWSKHLAIGRGGMILTDDGVAAAWLRRARFDGRREGTSPAHDCFDIPGWHCYMIPELAARGLSLLPNLADDNPDLPKSDYPDLSKYPIFSREGKPWHR